MHDGRQGGADDWNAQEARARIQGDPFNRCTHTALSPQGDIYVSDGYANARVHKYSPDGKLLFSWGEPGTDPGQFNLVHNIACDDEGWVYVADRENHRVQVFDSNGKYERSGTTHAPVRSFRQSGKEPIAVIGELDPETVASLTKGVVEVNESEVAALAARGYLPDGAHNDPAAIKGAIEGVISDMAFELQQETTPQSLSTFHFKGTTGTSSYSQQGLVFICCFSGRRIFPRETTGKPFPRNVQ